MENLVVTTPGFLALLFALALTVILLAVWRWRHRQRVSAVLTALVAVVLVLASAADVVNAHYEYVPQIRDVADLALPGIAYPRVAADVAAHPATRQTQHGGVVSISLPDGHDGLGSTHALVYLPAAYFRNPTDPLPVAYLIHGSPGSAEDWFRAAHAASVGDALDSAGTPAVLVAPTMSRGWTDDSECVDGRSEKVETHLLDVVVPAVEQRFLVRKDRADRILAGNSAGGFCALNLGLRNRDVFGTIVDLSGYTKPTYDGGMAKLFGTTLAPRELAAVVSANTPAEYVPTLPTGPQMRIWLDAGSGDHDVRREETSLSADLRVRPDVTAVLVTRPGGHTYGVWRPALRAGLLWALSSPTAPADSLT